MLQYPILYGHHNFAFNSHLDPDGTIDQSDLHDTVLLDERDPEPLFRDLRDPYHLAQGGSLGSVHKGLFVLPLRGRIEVPNDSQQKSLGDRERAMRAAFDPYLCYVDSPATDGAYPFDFQEDTEDSAYPTGRIPLRYYMRPAAQPRISEVLTDRSWKPFRLALVAGDPRMYEQTEQTLALVAGGVYTPGSTLNRGTTAAPLKVTITMSGAGASNFTISRLGVNFVLDLTRYSVPGGGDVIVVLMETSGPYGIGKSIIRAAGPTNDFDAKTSGPGSWLDVPVGTTPFTLANTSNVSACTLAWHSARA